VSDERVWEFTETAGVWSVRGAREGRNNVEFLHGGEVVHTLTCPGHQIEQYRDHLKQLIPQLEKQVATRAPNGTL
jgi:hypothetical protein